MGYLACVCYLFYFANIRKGERSKKQVYLVFLFRAASIFAACRKYSYKRVKKTKFTLDFTKRAQKIFAACRKYSYKRVKNTKFTLDFTKRAQKIFADRQLLEQMSGKYGVFWDILGASVRLYSRFISKVIGKW